MTEGKLCMGTLLHNDIVRPHSPRSKSSYGFYANSLSTSVYNVLSRCSETWLQIVSAARLDSTVTSKNLCPYLLALIGAGMVVDLRHKTPTSCQCIVMASYSVNSSSHFGRG